jgi:murein DD-endopeptidase MepM/ murein hydrolase activator NlpD
VLKSREIDWGACSDFCTRRAHADNSVAAHAHLMTGKIFVTKNQQVVRGQVTAVSGNTGNTTTAHLHVDVRSFWHSPSDNGPTIPVYFEANNHVYWRLKVGDVLDSNNNWIAQLVRALRRLKT